MIGGGDVFRMGRDMRAKSNSQRAGIAALRAIVLSAPVLSTLVLSTLALSALVLSAAPSEARDSPDYWQPGWMRHQMWGRSDLSGEMQARMRRHWTYMNVGIPEKYIGAKSTVPLTPENVAEGRGLYVAHCQSCHGAAGLGDGEAGRSLTPSPALLAYMIQRPVSVDEYLLWTISEGGAEFETAMPAFGETLSREEVWKIIAFMRSGFPEETGQ